MTVGEAPGHVRDTEMALIESGVGEALGDSGLKFADLNYEEVQWQQNRGRVSPLKGIYPAAICGRSRLGRLHAQNEDPPLGRADLQHEKTSTGYYRALSMAGRRTCCTTTAFPKTVVDINASLPNTLAIVDGIDCMEGDGPILGTMKHMGLMLVGTNLPAVDATAARIHGHRTESRQLPRPSC